MSDGEVKRWETISIDSKIHGTRRDCGAGMILPVTANAKVYMVHGDDFIIEVMPVEDHDSIVAELKAKVFDLKSVQESLIETAAKNDDYYEFESSRLREQVATQAKVIERLREQRNWALTELGQYPEQAIANDDAEIAAIGTQFEEEK